MGAGVILELLVKNTVVEGAAVLELLVGNTVVEAGIVLGLLVCVMIFCVETVIWTTMFQDEKKQ